MDSRDKDKASAPTEPEEVSPELVAAARRGRRHRLRKDAANGPLEERTASLGSSRYARRSKSGEASLGISSGRSRRLELGSFIGQVGTIFGLGILIALAIGAIGSIDWSAWSSANKEMTYREPFFEPLFGPSAVLRCQSRCGNWSGEDFPVCRQSCDRYSFPVYGRRITDRPLNPEADGEAMLRGCSQYATSRARSTSEPLWRKQANLLASVLRDFQSSTDTFEQQFNRLIAVGEQLALPPQRLQRWDKDARELLHISCLQAQLLLTEMALQESRSNADQFSVEFYAKLRESLVVATSSSMRTLELLQLPEVRER